ncbi:MAG: endolytic transglycosylase MltG [Betaproteobacteria bacterium]|nr:endolytic transglycosylase MltG [Betaproteobacteria bacterium]
MLKLILFLLTLALAAAGGLFWYAATPPQSAAAYPLEVTVKPGDSLAAAAQSFARVGALQQPLLLRLLARATRQSGALKPGLYRLDKPLTPLALLRKLAAGDTVPARLTVVEGWTFADMRRAVDAAASLRHDSRGMSDADLLQAIGAKPGAVEGRFFPDTYVFDHGVSDLAIYKRSWQAMERKLKEAWESRAQNLPYRTPEEALVMASIIEKETGAPEERPQIASVFINRLRIGMRLQTDPTVIYGMGAAYDGNIRKRDLERDTPWNTYTRAGLPPTPIALPGEAALHAAVNPEAGKALYFVATSAGGRHVFSSTLTDHNRAVSKYQRGGR